MTRGRAPISSGRYVPVIINGQRQWTRDQVALQAEVLFLLERDGAMSKNRIIMTLSTAQAAIETALAALLQKRQIECYKAMSARNRLDEHWCLFGNASTKSGSHRFNADVTLAKMQAHALTLTIGDR